jgi:hypothetical protein
MFHSNKYVQNMKKKLYVTALAMSSVIMLSSCEDFLNPESKTNITVDYLSNSPDGLSRAAIGLYALEREVAKGGDNGGGSNIYIVNMCDYTTDLLAFRAGTSTAIAKLENFMPNNGDVESFWQHHYFIIGKANEIIAGAEALGLDDSLTRRAYGEAKFFRGRAYFELWKRFERLYLNTVPTTVDNLNRDFTPASKEDIFTLIRTDLDDAIEMLDWKIPDNDYGRVTKATAKHVRAQVAMWDKDYDKAIKECEDIFEDGTYYMEDKAGDVFNGADFRSSEVLWSYQFSQNLGGGGSGTPLAGHRVAIITTTRYQSNAGCTFEASYGGYGWGRVYPNTYLFSLFDKDKDNRYQDLFIHTFYYNDPTSAKYGQEIPKDLYGAAAGYMEKLHPMSKKHFDQWTNADQPDRTTSFRDLIVYRLAETYLMCSEAYFHRDGGSSPKAIEYYNKTWERAGNAHENGPLTLDMLLDEYARELHFEGVRWSLLKRLGLLGERVRLHGGDLKSEDPYLDKDYAEPRQNFVVGKHETWPIPQNQVDLMGDDVFPQSDPWK